jgi:peptide/nickel transport system ATP-binding protein
LLSGARYLVADEISAMLDPVTQAQIWHVLRGRVRAGQLGILAISHDDGLLDAVAADVGRHGGSRVRWRRPRRGLPAAATA